MNQAPDRPALHPFDPAGELEPGITLLEASAGTGKTYTITSILLRLVAEFGIPLREILVVTFTEAATAELQDRVRQRLREALTVLEEQPQPLRPQLRLLFDDPVPVGPLPADPVLAHLVRRGGAVEGRLTTFVRRLRLALDSFDQAEISTIHGFCSRMLRQHAFESGAAFDAELVAELGPLLEEVVQDGWTQELHAAPEPVVRFLLGQSRLHFRSLLALAARVAEQPELELVPPASATDGPPVDGRRWRAALAALQERWPHEVADFRRLLLGAIAAKQLSGKSQRTDWAVRRLERVQAWLTSNPRPGLGVAEPLHFLSQEALAAATRPGCPVLRHVLPFCISELLAAEAELQQSLCDRPLQLLHRLAAYARQRLAQRKLERHLQSYDDLLRLLQAGLLDPARGPLLRQAIRTRYQAALIDEFQDTDPVQWSIFREVFGDGARRLFLIGDPKQAIYGFRGADIFTYLQAQASADRGFTLRENWRSDAHFLEALNQLFHPDRLAAPFVFPGIGYVPVSAPPCHAVERLRSAAARPTAEEQQELAWGGPVVPLQFRFVPRTGDETKITKGVGSELVARLVAVDIARFLQADYQLREDAEHPWRPVRPGDVAVLVRTHRQADQLQQALRDLRIPAVLHGASSVLRSHEATELFRLLAALDAPALLPLLRAALATDLLGLSANELVAFEQDETGLEAWIARGRAWAAVWQAQGFMRLFRQLLAETGLAERVLAWPDGERRMTNLLHLAELLHRAEQEQQLGPAGLLTWLRRARAEEQGDADAQQLRLESDADAVELVTIHRCKGLQYPVVWCPFLWDGALLRREEQRWLRFHDPARDQALTLDLGPDDHQEPRQSHLRQAEYEQQAEHLRLTYVALTRARHLCVVYWGRFNQAERSPLAYLLHQPRGGSVDGRELLAATAARVADAGDPELLGDLQRLVAACPQGLGVTVVARTATAAPYQPPVPPPPVLAARTYERPGFDLYWRRTSFTGLTRGSHAGWPAPVVEARERDEPLSGAPTRITPPDLAEEEPLIPLHDFPAGAEIGICWHKILQLHDFQAEDPAVLRQLTDEQLCRHGLGTEQAELLAAGLAGVLRTPLDEGTGAAALTLSRIPRTARLDELAFDLPVAGGLTPAAGAMTCRALADVFHRHRGPGLSADYPHQLRQLDFLPVRGFLTGSLDLVFRHAGRWWLVDYKSNHLGPRLTDYRPDRLAAAMAGHHYYLQYHLYTLALHRYLGARLPGYRYEAHFGGVFYLFLRGMVGEGSGGVFRDRPPAELIEGLDRLMRNEGRGTRGEG